MDKTYRRKNKKKDNIKKWINTFLDNKFYVARDTCQNKCVTSS